MAHSHAMHLLSALAMPTFELLDALHVRPGRDCHQA